MNFTSVESVDQCVWDMKLADYPRGVNRAEINKLFNGNPPYTDDEVIQNNIEANFNDLTATRIATAARGQLYHALVSPDPVINIECDYGPVWKRMDWGTTMSRVANRIIGNESEWKEEERSTFAQMAVHGIGPAIWPTQQLWCPTPKEIGDVLIPGGTYRSLKNLPFFAVYEQYTGAELIRLTSGPNIDKGWNMPLVKSLIAWQEEQAKRMMGNNWPQTWSPEKWAERRKEDAGCYAFDTLPTIDTWHFYFWSDDGKNSGWRKRVILDSWGEPGTGYDKKPARGKNGKHGKNGDSRSEFLFDPGTRKYADKLGELIHFQFGDCSPVAPFRYHSVRGLGLMMYAVCQVQNRLKCKFTDAAFESCMQYFRVTDPTDHEKVTKINLIHAGVIPDGVNFMPQAERWNMNENQVLTALAMQKQTVADNSASFTSDNDFGEKQNEETATRTMAKINSSNALIGAMLEQAYDLQKYKLMEVVRRLCIKDSRDPAARMFRVECLKAGIPPEAMIYERLNIQPVRVIGNGNKMMQIAMMDKMMAVAYEKVGPEAQKQIMRRFGTVNSDDPQFGNSLVPDAPHVTDTTHDAQLTADALLGGRKVDMATGANPQEVIEAMLGSIVDEIKVIQSTTKIPTQKELFGMGRLIVALEGQIKIMSQDKGAKQKVKMFQDAIGKISNVVKAFGQQLAEQQKAAQKQQGQGGGVPPEAQAKIATDALRTKAKIQLGKEAHASKQAQKQVAFEQKMKEQAEQHAAAMQKDADEHRLMLIKEAVKTVGELKKSKLKSVSEE